jgi:Zn-dependent protease
MINLFNLIPIWQLDGARGLHSLARNQRILLLILSAALWIDTRNGMLFLIVMGAAYRLFKTDAAQAPDDLGMGQFALLLLALSLLPLLLH